MKNQLRKVPVCFLALLLCCSMMPSIALADGGANGDGGGGGAIWDGTATKIIDSKGAPWEIAVGCFTDGGTGMYDYGTLWHPITLTSVSPAVSLLPRTATDLLYCTFELSAPQYKSGWRVNVFVDALSGDAEGRLVYLVEYQDGSAEIFDSIVGDTQAGISSLWGHKLPKRLTIVVNSSYRGPIGVVARPEVPKTSLAKASVSVKAKAWTGKTLKPAAPTVKLGGKTLRSGVDYAWSCKGGRAVGSYKVTVTGKGAYAGTKTATFKIVPKGTSVKKLSKAKRAFTVKWKKPSKAHLKQTTGYQVRWSTSKKFTKKTTKTMTVKATSAAGKKCTLKVSKLKAKKTYYVQVRTYKKVGGKTYYSSWSKAKAVKTKR